MNVRVLGPADGARAAGLRGPVTATGSRRVGLLGGGVIGGGWAARFLLNGVDVAAVRPRPRGGAQGRARCSTTPGARYGRLTLAPLPAEGAAESSTRREEAVAGAEFVQESAPERLDAEAGAAGGGERARPDPTSSSPRRRPGLLPTRLQADMAPPGAAHRRPPVQPGLPAAARRGRAAASGPRRRRSSAPPASTARVGMRPLRAAARDRRRSSPTGCSRRCGARRCGSSPTTSRRSRRSTTRSASAPACAGRRWARSSPTGSPAARRACGTSWPSSGRRCSGRGRS